LHGLFEPCNTIASLRYEGAEGEGSIVIARKNHAAIDQHVTFANPVNLAEFRASRKLLEMCRGSMALICNSHAIHALGMVTDRYDPTAEDVFVIRFAQKHTWELVHASQVLMRTSYGNPTLLHAAFNSARFAEILGRVIPGVAEATVNHLISLAEKVAEAEHGTTLVISRRAKDEAVRLETQSTRLEPIALTPDMLSQITTIDGAVLMTPDAECHAIGVILDGRATPKGNPSRGSRYNSAVRYVEQEKDCVAVVVSDDGMIDILPDLRPRIRRSTFESMMQRFHALSAFSAPDYSEYHAVMDWLSKHRFYLSNSACDEINRLWKSICDKLPREGFRTLYDAFTPNTDMNAIYLIDD